MRKKNLKKNPKRYYTEEELVHFFGYLNRVQNLESCLRDYGYRLTRSRKQDKTNRPHFRVVNPNGSYSVGGNGLASSRQIFNWLFRKMKKGELQLYFQNEPESHKKLDSRHEFFISLYDVFGHNYHPRYVVTSYGYIINLDRSIIGTPAPYFLDTPPAGQGKNSYLQCPVLTLKGFSPVDVHRAVALAFCPNAKGKGVVHHIDDDKTNNYYVNLLWVTEQEHGELHRLLNQGDMNTYYRRVREIYEDNCDHQRCFADCGWFRTKEQVR